jgi:hypothetical protein
MTATDERKATLRRSLGWALVGGLTVAAVTASIALVTGSFDDDDWRVIGTSLGFAVFSAIGAAGLSLRLSGGGAERLLGAVTVALAAAAFLLLLAALWIDDDADGLWRTWGCVSLAALACSHASLVTGARRPTDSDVVSALVTISIGLAAIDAIAGILPLAEVVEDVEEGVVEIVGVLVIGLLLTTALPPIMRRLGGPSDVPARPTGLAADVLAAADRIERLSGGDERLRAEAERLRELARTKPS